MADAVTHALLAVEAARAANPAAARAQIDDARRCARAAARRERQVVEIAALIVDHGVERASGLAAIHAAEFRQDAELLSRLVGS